MRIALVAARRARRAVAATSSTRWGWSTVRWLAVLAGVVVAVADVARATPMTAKPERLSAAAARRARWRGVTAARGGGAGGGEAEGEAEAEREAESVMRPQPRWRGPLGADGTSGPGS